MERTVPYFTENYRRYFAVLVALIFVLLTSCPIKSSLKNLAGIPVNTEQRSSAKKNNPLLGNGMELCAQSDLTDAKISPTVSSNTNDLLPTVLLITALFFLFCGYFPDNEPSKVGYHTLKISHTLPIFLRHRQLII